MKLELANHFGIDTSKLQYLLTMFSAAVTFMVMANKFLIEKIPIKTNLLFSSFLIILGTVGMTTAKTIAIFSVYLTTTGLGIGLYTSMANYLIINLYNENRASKLIMLHACYSICAVITPIAAAFIINSGFSWTFVSRLFLVIVALSVFMALKSDFTSISKQEKENNTTARTGKEWGVQVYLSCVAIFSYTFFEAVFNYWIVEYLVKLNINPQISKLGISMFWVFIVIGRIIAANLTQYMKLGNFIKISSLLSGFAFLGLLFTTKTLILFILIALIGIGSSALYPSIISFGTYGRTKVDSSLMTTIIISGSFGIILSSPVSGFLNENFSAKGALISGLISIFLVFFAITIAAGKKR
jgi:fucose permease